MKKLITFSFLLFCSINLFAQTTSNIIVFTEQGEQFWLVVNGVKQNNDPQTNVKVTGLNQPSYKVKVIFKDNTIPDLDKTVYLMDGGNPVVGEWSYNIKKNNKNEYVMRQLSYVPIAQAAPPAPNQQVIVFGTVPTTAVVTTQPTGGTVTQQTTTTTTSNPDNVNMNMNIGGVGLNMNVNVSGMDVNSSQTTTTTTTITTNGTTVVGTQQPTTVVYVPGYSGPTGCAMPMAPTDFEAAKSTISSQSFASSKVTVAKQIANSNCFTADQVKQLVQLMDFEADKLEVAKYCYAHTYDKGNYFKINDAFEFSSSVDELNQYIGGQ